MEIEWKDILGYEGKYRVSTNGEIYSEISGKILKQFYRGSRPDNKYLVINLCENNKQKTVSVHRLVAQAFIPNPNNLPCVNHIDGNKDNNCVENLEWCTYLENNVHAYQYLGKTQRNKRGSKPVLQFDLSNNFIKEYPSVREAIRQTGITSIDKVCKKKQNRKQAGGFKWKYKEEII